MIIVIVDEWNEVILERRICMDDELLEMLFFEVVSYFIFIGRIVI